MKRLLSVWLAVALLFSLTACKGSDKNKGDVTDKSPQVSGDNAEDVSVNPEVKPAKTVSDITIGVAMPTQVSQRWIYDGANIADKLETLGYQVDLRYASNETEVQQEQVKEMIDNSVDCLVISPVSSTSLSEVLEQAKAKNIPVIAYDRLIMNTDAVSYYVSFDNKAIGLEIGKYVETKLGLATGGGPYNIEFFAGPPSDNNARIFHDGILEVLREYIDNDQLNALSGRAAFDGVSTPGWSQESARERMSTILDTYYSEAKLDAVVTSFDGLAYGVIDALESAGYTDEGWPMITGQDAELLAAKNILEGKQAHSVFKDTRVLADKCVQAVEALLEGRTPEANDTTSYDNSVIVVPAYLCQAVTIDKDNLYEQLIDSGYYTLAELEG